MVKIKYSIYLVISTFIFCLYYLFGCSEGSTELMTAVRHGDVFKVQALLKSGNSTDVNKKDWYGDSALSIAVINNRVEIVSLLLKNGADANVKTGSGWPILARAVFNGNLEISEMLIDHGADVNVKTEDGSTPLMKSIRKDTKLPILRLLLEKGAKVNYVDGASPPLVLACKKTINADLAVIKILVENGANLYSVVDGETALQAAIERGDKNIISYIKKRIAEAETGVR